VTYGTSPATGPRVRASSRLMRWPGYAGWGGRCGAGRLCAGLCGCPVVVGRTGQGSGPVRYQWAVGLIQPNVPGRSTSPADQRPLSGHGPNRAAHPAARSPTLDNANVSVNEVARSHPDGSLTSVTVWLLAKTRPSDTRRTKPVGPVNRDVLVRGHGRLVSRQEPHASLPWVSRPAGQDSRLISTEAKPLVVVTAPRGRTGSESGTSCNGHDNRTPGHRQRAALKERLVHVHGERPRPRGSRLHARWARDRPRTSTWTIGLPRGLGTSRHTVRSFRIRPRIYRLPSCDQGSA
jgi:hypothetical protein